MDGLADLMVELRAGLDAAAAQIGAEKLLLSVCRFLDCKMGSSGRSLMIVCGSLW